MASIESLQAEFGRLFDTLQITGDEIKKVMEDPQWTEEAKNAKLKALTDYLNPDHNAILEANVGRSTLLNRIKSILDTKPSFYS
jgi:hypothetical protein